MILETYLIFMGAVQSLKICTLMGSFVNSTKFQLKKYRRVISHDTKERFKLWGKTDFLLEKWHAKFSEF